MNLHIAPILFAALILSACRGDSGNPMIAPTPAPTPSPAPPAASATATITIPMGASNLTSSAFAPNPLTISVGTTLTFVNNDTTTHDATAVVGSFATGSIAPGSFAAVTLQTAGSFQYYCTIHPGMTGRVTVQ